MATETLEQKIARLEAENAQLKQENTDAQGVIDDQAERLANAEAAQGDTPSTVLTYEKQQYRVLGQKFLLDGVEIEAAKLADNKEAIKALLDARSGLLVLITKQEEAK